MEKSYRNSTHPFILIFGLSIFTLIIYFIYSPPNFIIIISSIILYFLIAQYRYIKIIANNNELILKSSILGVNFRTVKVRFDSILLDTMDVIKFRKQNQDILELDISIAAEESESLSMTVRYFRHLKIKSFEIGTKKNNIQMFNDILNYYYKSSIFKARHEDNRHKNGV